MFCPFCGADIANASNFCPQCGKALNANAAPGNAPGKSVFAQIAESVDALSDWLADAARRGADALLKDDPNAGSFLLFNILGAAFLFLPTGVVGVYYSVLAGQAKKRGDAAETGKLAKRARVWFWTTVLCGLVVAPIALRAFR